MGHLQTWLAVLERRTSFCLGKPERTKQVVLVLGICALWRHLGKIIVFDAMYIASEAAELYILYNEF